MNWAFLLATPKSAPDTSGAQSKSFADRPGLVQRGRPLLLWIAAALVVLVIAAAPRVLLNRSPAEPVCADRPLGAWLEDGVEPASVALREIGAPAVPYLLAKLRREDPNYGSYQHYRKFWDRMPGMLRPMLPKPKSGSFDQARTCNFLLAIGPQAFPAILRGLGDANPAVRAACAWALGNSPKARTELPSVLPALVRCLNDPNPEVRQRAAWAIQQVRPEPDRRAPAQSRLSCNP
jgi:HEAT repeat protein